MPCRTGKCDRVVKQHVRSVPTTEALIRKTMITRRKRASSGRPVKRPVKFIRGRPVGAHATERKSRTPRRAGLRKRKDTGPSLAQLQHRDDLTDKVSAFSQFEADRARPNNLSSRAQLARALRRQRSSTPKSPRVITFKRGGKHIRTTTAPIGKGKKLKKAKGFGPGFKTTPSMSSGPPPRKRRRRSKTGKRGLKPARL
jgi:hypothetical protein